MRRFEFAEGSSHKFWEIALEGTGFTVRWGRLGTEGQTQQKSFPSDQKAQSEHDKLIAEKVKKGYAEIIGGASVPAPAPTPKAASAPTPKAAPAKAAPAPAPVPKAAPAPSGPIFWTESLQKRVLPRRGGVAVDVRAPLAPKKAWPLIREEYRKCAAHPVVQDTHADNLTAPSEALARRMASAEPSLGTPEEDAVLLTFLRHKTEANQATRTEPAIDLFFALGGPEYATRATLLSLDMYLSGSLDFRARRGAPVASIARYNRLRMGHTWGLPRLRALLATHTDDAGYQAARDVAASLRLSDEQCAAAAFLFPTETAWVRADAEVFAQEHAYPFLLSAVSEPESLALLLPGLESAHLMREDTDFAPSLLDGLGRQSLPFFQQLMTPPYPYAAYTRAWAELVASIDSDEALRLLLEQREHKEVLALLVELAPRCPARMLRMLAPMAGTRGKDGDVARNVLVHLLRVDPTAVRAALSGQSAEVQEVIARLQGQAGPDVPDATPEQLPPVLAQVPWASGGKPEALPVLPELTAPPLPDALEWREGEHDAWQRREGDDYFGFQDFTPERWTEFARGLELEGREGNVHRNQLDPAFFALAPEALARKHLAHLQLDFWNDSGEWVARLIARLGLAVLPLLRAHAAGDSHVLSLLAPFAVADLAPAMAHTARTRRGRAPARDWLLRHPAHATAGLLADALGKPGKDKDAACAALRWLAAEGHRDTVLDVAARATPSPPVREAVARILDFNPLNLFPARRPKVPEGLGIEGLPRPLLADRSARLPLPAMDALVTMLTFSSIEEPYAGLEQVKAACDPASLARFAWGLFEAWLVTGAPSKEGWAFQALGLLGDDDTARKLAPLIRQWPGETAHARAVTGLDILAAIGTDVTLVYLNGIAEKVKFKGLQQKAQEKIEQIAEQRGLTREELADRLVPDLGLDAQGSLTLDFGPRSFTVGFDEQLKPFVRDAQGAPLKDLPKPAKTDDADKASAAAEQWKALKKDAKTAAAIQLMRLELAMCARRRWEAAVFRQFFVNHPLIIHGVRRLIWGVYSPEGALTTPFRVTEDRSLADVNEDTFTLPEGALVGLPHALELDAKTAGAWGQVLADYQLLQPFAQLGRPTHAPSAAEREGTKLERVQGLRVPTGKVLGLEKFGWRRGEPQDGGVVCWMEKPLGNGWRAELELNEGIYTGMISESPEQILGAVVVRSGQSWGDQGLQRLGQLDAILFSELVRDLESLRLA